MKKLVILSAGLALAACNSDKEGTFQTDDGSTGTYSVDSSGDGGGTLTVKTQDGEFNVQSGPNAKIDPPAGFSLYPGAEVISNTTLNGPSGKNATLTMNSKAALDQVVGFYRKQAETAGVEIKTEIKAGDAVMLGGETKSGMIFALNAGPADKGGTTAHLSLSQK